MRIHVCIRRTLEWSDEAFVAEHMIAALRPKAAAWNATFNMTYAAFRQRLKEIAQLNLARVEGVALTPLQEVPQGELVVPVDDDDWLAPNVAHEIREVLRPGLTGYHWHRQVISAARRRRRLFRLRRNKMGGRNSCATNNYAVVNTPESVPLSLSHMTASTYFDNHAADVARIRKTLSIQNRSLGSKTALAWRDSTISRDDLVEVLHGYRNLYADWKLGSVLAWAQPCLDSMAELTDMVRVR